MEPSANGNGNGRDLGGRFAAGNKGGPGNPHNKRVHENRKLWLECVEPAHIKHFYARLGKLADAGDVAALKLWLEYAIGRPAQAIEVTGPEGQSIDLAAVAGVVLEVIGDDDATRLRLAAAFARLGRIGGGSDGDGEPGPHP